MAKIPRVRCPVCGHLVFLRNVAPGRRHKIQAVVHYIYSRGRGKIRHKYVEEPLPDGLIDFWLRRLEEVILYLRKLKPKKLNSTLVLKAKQQEAPNLECPVLEKSVLTPMDSSLRFQPMQTRNVPNASLTISSKGKATLGLRSNLEE